MAAPLPPPPPPPAGGGRAYAPPAWGRPPAQPWALAVLRDGVLAESVALAAARDHHIVGKRADVCDIVLSHDSISRSHAALQFGEAGELYVTDLGSTHGTRLNKRPLARLQYALAPVGSVLQFGASSRLYVVEGPAAFAPPEPPESGALAAARAQSEARQARKAQERLAGGGGAGGVSWGQAEDAVDDGCAFQPDDDDTDADGRASARAVIARLGWLEQLDLAQLAGAAGERARGAHDRLHRTLLKLRHLTAESARIRAKQAAARLGGGGGGGGSRGRSGSKRGGDDNDSEADGDGCEDGLSAGQAAQLARNEEAVERLLDTVPDDELALKQRLVAAGAPLPKGVPPPPPHGGADAAGAGRGGSATHDDEDDVDDRSGGGRSRLGGGQPSLGARGVFVLRKRAAPSGSAPIADAAAASWVAAATTMMRASAPASVTATAGLAPASGLATRSSSSGSSGSSFGAGGGGGAHTYDGLSAQLADVERDLALLEDEDATDDTLAAAAAARGGGGASGQPAGGVAAAGGGTDEGDDALDAFMRTATAALSAAECAARAARMASLRVEQARLAALVAVAKPALAGELWLPQSANVLAKHELSLLQPPPAPAGAAVAARVTPSAPRVAPSALGAAAPRGVQPVLGGGATSARAPLPPSTAAELAAVDGEVGGPACDLRGTATATAAASAPAPASAAAVPSGTTAAARPQGPVATVSGGAKRLLGPALPPPSVLLAGAAPGESDAAIDGAGAGAGAAAGATAPTGPSDSAHPFDGAGISGDGGGGTGPPTKRARVAVVAGHPPSSVAAVLAQSRQQPPPPPPLHHPQHHQRPLAGAPGGAPRALAAHASQQHTHSEGEDVATWRPPPGQTGDGRTELNDRLGY